MEFKDKLFEHLKHGDQERQDWLKAEIDKFFEEDSLTPDRIWKNQRVIQVRDWDDLVKKTYNRPYCFQQQEGCQSRGTLELTIPSEDTNEEEMNESIPEEINGEEMGVKFNTWLSRDPKEPVEGRTDYYIRLFWERNFYPDIQTVANDLYNKGLIEAGDYVINIDW